MQEDLAWRQPRTPDARRQSAPRRSLVSNQVNAFPQMCAENLLLRQRHGRVPGHPPPSFPTRRYSTFQVANLWITMADKAETAAASSASNSPRRHAGGSIG